MTSGSSARSVTASGMRRSMPSSCNQMTHWVSVWRPVVMAINRKVRPNRGCLGSMTRTVSSAEPVMLIGVLLRYEFDRTHQAFGLRILGRFTHLGHADLHPMCSQDLDILG